MYGSNVSAGSYQFHRTVPFDSANVQENRFNNCAFDIMGVEKSFVVICPDPAERQLWVDIIRRGIAAARPAATIGQNNLASAPVWVPDDEASSCSVCRIGFSLTRRRHHCRKCGDLVCGDCSKSRVVLPHIGTKKVREIGRAHV